MFGGFPLAFGQDEAIAHPISRGFTANFPSNSLSVLPLIRHLSHDMMTNRMAVTADNDAELVRATLAGDREAFSLIVARYQALICTLTYTATGNLGHSEDLAQETFVTAWDQLANLREPEKLRSWLCGIARNLVNNSLRKQMREPSHAAASIEEVSESHSPEPLPVEHTISKEEQAILWRSLERIPETYREPLVLFYREHQSVEAVAEKLDLTQVTVHQRLSRGRKLLAEEVTAFVEGALSRTKPGQAFTLGVMAALPITLASSAKAASLAAAAKGGATVSGTSIISVVLGFLTGPALGFLFAFFSIREAHKMMRTQQERSALKRAWLVTLAGGILFFVSCSAYSAYVAPRLSENHPALVLTFGWMLCLSWAVFIFTFAWRHGRTMMRLREEARQSNPELYRDEQVEAFEYRSRATLFGLPLVHWRSFGKVRKPGEKVEPAIGWIAIGERAYGILYASGAVAVGCLANGCLSIGLFAFGGCSIGLIALGGFALGGIALGGGAIGWIASGGIALGWHAAMGGMVGAHDIALGGEGALGNHVNDAVAREFFQNHRWLDFTRGGPWGLFWLLCFGPMFVQMAVWMYWRRKMKNRAKQTSGQN